MKPASMPHDGLEQFLPPAQPFRLQGVDAAAKPVVDVGGLGGDASFGCSGAASVLPFKFGAAAGGVSATAGSFASSAGSVPAAGCRACSACKAFNSLVSFRRCSSSSRTNPDCSLCSVLNISAIISRV